MIDPNKLLDNLSEKLNVKNDSRLAKALKATPPTLSKIRHGRLPVGAPIIVKASLATGMNVADIQALGQDALAS